MGKRKYNQINELIEIINKRWYATKGKFTHGGLT